MIEESIIHYDLESVVAYCDRRGFKGLAIIYKYDNEIGYLKSLTGAIIGFYPLYSITTVNKKSLEKLYKEGNINQAKYNKFNDYLTKSNNQPNN